MMTSEKLPTAPTGYQPAKIESKWQNIWSEKQTFTASNPGEPGSEKPPFYVLDMFPYPSGAGLHVGHPLGYIASDIISRYKRHQGYNVLHPIGFDSFGLPAEQYAIQTGQHPATTTSENIQRYRSQLDKMGFSFDWNRELRTSDPQYYQWTQWIFLQMFESWYNPKSQKAEPISTLMQLFSEQGSMTVDTGLHPSFSADEWAGFSEQEQQGILMEYRLAYLSEAYVNWCPALGTVLANDEVKDGFSERGGHPVERKKMKQWSMRITAYGERLLEGLHTLDWSDNLKEIQRHWIGKSSGASVFFKLSPKMPFSDWPDIHKGIEVFTTRPDTLFGVSYLTLAPEHDWVTGLTSPDQRQAVEEYLEYVKGRSERDRQSEVKKITGVFTGSWVIHPFTGEELPVWLGEYVLSGYGTGAVMGVPAHDDRDFAFAQFFDLPIKRVVQPNKECDPLHAWTEKSGVLTDSDFLNGMEVKDAIPYMIQQLEKHGYGKGKTTYRLRDAVYGRQRYWGEPIPIYYKNGLPYAIRQEHLPLCLPDVDAYLPTEEGEPPLARASHWRYHPEKGVVASDDAFPIEPTTMPGWAGSSWYFYRFMDAQNPREFASYQTLQYWNKVDFYIGGAEHATGHLLYARFWSHFLHDLGLVPHAEPFQKLLNQGMIQGESAIVYRVKNKKILVSADQIHQHDVIPLHIDIHLVQHRKVQVQDLRHWREEFRDFGFIEGEHGFLCDRCVEKMSKSKWNVVNPDDVCEEYGADTLRMYEMFLGPIEDSKPWSTQGIEGVYKFLKKTWKLFYTEQGEWRVTSEKASDKALKILHKTIKKITRDIEQLSFNTSISAFMICVNELQELDCRNQEVLEPLLVLLSPFAPHFSEELWEHCGHHQSISFEPWPCFNEELLVENSFEYPISINGKLRTKLMLPLDMEEKEVSEQVLNHEVVIKWTEGKTVQKFIFVKGKIINVVVS
jgi:leucyl-tRNA synthetase